jgi:drug/metabolite transporter (DMT)-like permease
MPTVSDGPSQLARLALGCLIAAMSAGCVMIARRASFSTASWGRLALAAVLMIGAPALLMRYAGEYSTDTNAAIVFALMPVEVVLVWGAVSNAAMGMSALLPALVGAAGVLLILPYELPVSGRAWWALAEVIAAMVLTGCGAVWLHRLVREASVTAAIFVGAAANLVVLSLCGSWRGHASWGWSASVWIAIVMQAAVVSLTVWLAGAIAPVRFSARFLIVPLLTIVEGAVLLRPGVDARLAIGVTLLLVGIEWLFANDGRVDEKVLSLR